MTKRNGPCEIITFLELTQLFLSFWLFYSMPITPILKYAVLSCSNSNSSNQNAKDMVDYRGNNPNYTGRTAFTDTTAVCMTPTGETGNL